MKEFFKKSSKLVIVLIILSIFVFLCLCVSISVAIGRYAVDRADEVNMRAQEILEEESSLIEDDYIEDGSTQAAYLDPLSETDKYYYLRESYFENVEMTDSYLEITYVPQELQLYDEAVTFDIENTDKAYSDAFLSDSTLSVSGIVGEPVSTRILPMGNYPNSFTVEFHSPIKSNQATGDDYSFTVGSSTEEYWSMGFITFPYYWGAHANDISCSAILESLFEGDNLQIQIVEEGSSADEKLLDYTFQDGSDTFYGHDKCIRDENNIFIFYSYAESQEESERLKKFIFNSDVHENEVPSQEDFLKLRQL